MTTHQHEDFMSLVSDYFENVSLNEKNNNESFKDRLSHFIKAPTTSNFQNLLMVSTSVERNVRDFLEANTLAIHFNEQFKDDFLPVEDITKSTSPANKGEVIMWCDEYYVVGDVHENTADVYNMDGTLESSDFRFGLEDEPHYVFGIKADMVDDIEQYNIHETPITSPDTISNRFKQILEDNNVNEFVQQTNRATKRNRPS